jgi:hypothetical protein
MSEPLAIVRIQFKDSDLRWQICDAMELPLEHTEGWAESSEYWVFELWINNDGGIVGGEIIKYDA